MHVGLGVERSLVGLKFQGRNKDCKQSTKRLELPLAEMENGVGLVSLG
jgi:hypothetical protein